MRDYILENDLREVISQKIEYMQYDNGSILKINLFENGKAVDLTGATVTVKFKREDNQEFSRTATISGNTITVSLDSTLTAIIGQLRIIFKITYANNSKQVSTFELKANIRENFGEGDSGSIGGNTSTNGGSSVNVDLSNYYTKAEIDTKVSELSTQLQSIVQRLIALEAGTVVTPDPPTPTETIVGTVGADNTITLTNLENGSYTLRYEDNDGVITGYDDIATMEVV